MDKDVAAPSDRRFADPTWLENPYFHTVLRTYLVLSDFARAAVGESGLDIRTLRKAELGLDLTLDAVSPSNFLLTNPAALKRAFETGGVSCLRGARNFITDVVQNRGRPRQVDSSPFTVGKNLAVTPAKVVYRNELMELLQYEPQTERVHEVPILCSPPWINKFYVMDLAPQRSFSSPTKRPSSGWRSTWPRLADFPVTGWPAPSMPLRANDLIFNYVVNNWLLGQNPPAFDILAWNGDSTRMPTAMHTFYLRNFYVHNALARGELVVGGTTVDLGAIDSDCYIVSAQNDHVVPWESAYKTTQLFSGDARFVLSNGGHIAGIVNPPNKKAWLLAADAAHPSASEFQDAAERTAGSWWNDWTVWSNTRAGDLSTRRASVAMPTQCWATGPGSTYTRAD